MPPGETRPTMWSVDLFFKQCTKSAWNAGFFSKPPSCIDFDIRTRSVSITRPAPIVMCPTSLLPMTPCGNPTLSSLAVSVACGYVFHSSSKNGFRASAIALCSLEARHPHPSRTMSAKGFIAGRRLGMVELGKRIFAGIERLATERLFDAQKFVVFCGALGAAH